MLILKIVFGIIVTLPILCLAEYLFEQVVDDALVGTTKKQRVPFLKRFIPHRKKRRKRDQEEEQQDIENI